MAHIHTKPGQIDYIAEVFVVYQNKVLLRLHDKHKIWIAPGGHIELNETPEVAAVREVKEETGLEVVLYPRQAKEVVAQENEPRSYAPLMIPQFMNIHDVNAEHRHLVFVFFGCSTSDTIIQPNNHENAECRWLNWEELEEDASIHPHIKNYAFEALKTLGSKP